MPIAARPEDARLAPGALDALAALRERLAVLAIVTGRAALDARRLLGDRSILIAGNHGLEWLEPGGDDPYLPEHLAEMLAPVPALVRESVAAVRERLGNVDGVLYEDKTVSATIHYRLAADSSAARAAILDVLAESGAATVLDVREGRMSVELRPRGAGGKGDAVRAIVERHALRGLLVFGDDRTDVDAFRAAAELRGSGRVSGLIAAVGAGTEVPAEVREAADVTLPSPAALVEVLSALR